MIAGGVAHWLVLRGGYGVDVPPLPELPNSQRFSGHGAAESRVKTVRS